MPSLWPFCLLHFLQPWKPASQPRLPAAVPVSPGPGRRRPSCSLGAGALPPPSCLPAPPLAAAKTPLWLHALMATAALIDTPMRFIQAGKGLIPHTGR